ncbi:alanyl-tRNA synthetase [Bacillus sp. THAF10]|uniref:alanine--tRNA ligase-related protein n=1 Tax=Bacillus sp. THAF10 TaxID=2587848 RepID=UPI0012A9C04B|nr:alanine--tRNA ligase-related protein [Bacillus sp. THAF10]QFT90091.1 alanyl-tRNA synthetase [Bacillus sp. THAF10]
MKLYYEDPYIKDFTATLVELKQDDENRWYAVLDKTAFYPEGGGQPFDKGMLNDVKVVEVQEKEGEIRQWLRWDASFLYWRCRLLENFRLGEARKENESNLCMWR